MSADALMPSTPEVLKNRTLPADTVVIGIIDAFSFLLNIFCIYLIKKQGLKTVDLWLASFMSIKDSLYILYLIGQLIAEGVVGRDLVYGNKTYGQIDGLIVTSMSLSSVNCVAFLAMIRFWCIYLKKSTNNTFWIGAYTMTQIVTLSVCIAVASSYGFRSMPSEAYYFPDPVSNNPANRLMSILLIIFNLFSIIAVNICYPLLTFKYFQKLQVMEQLDDHPIYPMKVTSRLQKPKTVIKTFVMLLLYNACMFPNLVISIKEQIFNKIRSYDEDVVVAISITLLYFVNPILFIVFHDRIYAHLKSILRSVFCCFQR